MSDFFEPSTEDEETISRLSAAVMRLRNTNAKTAAELERAREDIAALVDAVNWFFAAMEDGWLVRNTENDADPDWAFKQLGYVMKLAAIKGFVAKHARAEGSG